MKSYGAPRGISVSEIPQVLKREFGGVEFVRWRFRIREDGSEQSVFTMRHGDVEKTFDIPRP